MSAPEPTPVSEQFNFSDADVTFQSSDGVLFRLHRKNLEFGAGGFPPSDILTQDEIVPLTETCITLDLLLQFMYPQRPPDLSKTSFEVLEPVAEAAEKYQVFSAMAIFNLYMKAMVRDHPLAVALYAAKHDYSDLLSEAAPLLIGMQLTEVIQMLPQLTLPWVIFLNGYSIVGFLGYPL
ncbi:hypothetical protein B0H14DRAFT_3904711 [Mycena olivaceomarginata]|nr:hypothetical protein B0H14DRAFT_3904711 [Mycena olivaceomarginata]